MPSTQKKLPPRMSPLAGQGDSIVDYASVSLRERKALTAIQVLCFNGNHEKAAAAIGKAMGMECPTTPGLCHSDEQHQLIWNGPNSWMIVASDAESGRAAGELKALMEKALGKLAAVVDQSHGRCGLRLSGKRAREVMMKNTAIDLHPRSFSAGQCALTSVAHMNATLLQVDDCPTYDLFVARSLARSFAQVMAQACQEFEND